MTPLRRQLDAQLTVAALLTAAGEPTAVRAALADLDREQLVAALQIAVGLTYQQLRINAGLAKLAPRPYIDSFCRRYGQRAIEALAGLERSGR